jgi:histone H3/H4
MTERSRILKDPKYWKSLNMKIQTSPLSRLMNNLMEKFDSITASFYKFTNS